MHVKPIVTKTNQPIKYLMGITFEDDNDLLMMSFMENSHIFPRIFVIYEHLKFISYQWAIGANDRACARKS